jgi:hypothetical protein
MKFHAAAEQKRPNYMFSKKFLGIIKLDVEDRVLLQVQAVLQPRRSAATSSLP